MRVKAKQNRAPVDFLSNCLRGFLRSDTLSTLLFCGQTAQPAGARGEGPEEGAGDLPGGDEGGVRPPGAAPLQASQSGS